MGFEELGEQRLLGALPQQAFPASRLPPGLQQRVHCGLAQREPRPRHQPAVGLDTLGLERRQQRGGPQRRPPLQ